MEVLTAFVRENARYKPPPETTHEASPKGPQTPRADIQAVLTVLGRRNLNHEERGTVFLDLTETSLCGADLTAAQLGNVDLADAHLEEAFLGTAHLEGAYLTNTHLGQASFVFANLKGAGLADADLEGADLEGTDLRHARLLRLENWRRIDSMKLANVQGVFNRRIRADLQRSVDVEPFIVSGKGNLYT